MPATSSMETIEEANARVHRESLRIMRDQLNDAAAENERTRDKLGEAYEEIGGLQSQLETALRSLDAARAEIARLNSAATSPA